MDTNAISEHSPLVYPHLPAGSDSDTVADMRRASLQSPVGPPVKHELDTQASTHRLLSPLKTTFSDSEGSDTASNRRTRTRRHGSASYLPLNRRQRSSTPRGRPLSDWCLQCLRIPASRKGKRHCLSYLGLVLLVVVVVLWHVLRTYEFQFEMSVFSRAWVKAEFDNIKPLKGCFNNLSPDYNMTKHLAGRRHMVSPGISLRSGLSCYDFAATITDLPEDQLEQLTIHSYWRSDLRPFGERQAAAIQSFLATQSLATSKFILWTNGAEALSKSDHIAPYLEQWPSNFEVRQVDMAALTRGTEIDGLLNSAGLYDKRAWVDGDALRLLVLYHHGGMWMDMDMLLTRDLHPLMESEFLLQWDCYDKPYFAMNGALMHFRKHSPYLCEAFHIMGTEPFPEPNSFTWGAHLYAKLHQRLLAAHVQPFAVLPWCFADPRNCRTDIRFPDPFLPDPPTWAGQRWNERDGDKKSGRELFEERVGYVFSIHLHNQWEKALPQGGWVESLLRRYSATIDERRGRGQ